MLPSFLMQMSLALTSLTMHPMSLVASVCPQAMQPSTRMPECTMLLQRFAIGVACTVHRD